jgi:hypothetical protein
MNLSVRDQKLILILLGIVIFIGVYLGVYSNYDKKAEALEQEMAALQPRLSELQAYRDKSEEYRRGIDEAKEIISAELGQYPNDVRSEDMLMYAVELENEVGLNVSSAAFTEAEYIMDLRSVREKADGSYETVAVSAYRSSMDVACSLTYPELKNTIEYINYTPYCTRLNSLAVSYDAETGELTGSVKIDKYFITGLDDTYYETYVPPMPLGTSNIFGTILPPPAAEPEASEVIVPEEPTPGA